ncbi:hypothetical protein BT96DRAFT_1003727 [Gymnopus androsaceus JB14]|uniref:Zn(2)-C6 fungal-type domain-containing protein n=1 Tax=Gymnopus androsaceus JB14 TaxID=1447944 RepID=A0A6A4GU03_9AGAR|nr:hypothetical protein BT96DRAFT_1003727 [Gymnopus androsaceus JB14]
MSPTIALGPSVKAQPKGLYIASYRNRTSPTPRGVNGFSSLFNSHPESDVEYDACTKVGGACVECKRKKINSEAPCTYCVKEGVPCVLPGQKARRAAPLIGSIQQLDLLDSDLEELTSSSSEFGATPSSPLAASRGIFFSGPSLTSSATRQALVISKSNASQSTSKLFGVNKSAPIPESTWPKVDHSSYQTISSLPHRGIDGFSSLFNSLGDPESEPDVDECDDEEIAPCGSLTFDVIPSLSLPPISPSMQSSGRGVSEGNKAMAKEEVDTPLPNQHEVLQNFFQSLLTSKQTGDVENKDPSLRTSSVLDLGKIQRTVGSLSSIYYDDHCVKFSFGSPTSPTEMYHGKPSALIPSEDEAFQVPRTSPTSPPSLEASQNGLSRSNSAGRIQAMHKLTGGTKSYNSSSSALDSGKPERTDMVPGGKHVGAFKPLRKMSLVRAAKDTEDETREEGSSLVADPGGSESPKMPIVPPTLPPLDSHHILRGEDTLVNLGLDSPQLGSEGGYNTTRSQETLVGPSYGDFYYGEDSSNFPDRCNTDVPPGGGLSWSNPYLWSVWREYHERQSAAQPEESV